MNQPTNHIQHVHDAIKGFHDTLIADGIPPELPETIHCPAEIYDLCIEQAQQFYPTVRFVREPDFEAFLTIMRDPLEVS